MPFTPAYNAQFAKPLLNQCIAIIQRDQAAAIAIVNLALAPINEFHKGPGLRTALPWLTISIGGLAFDPEVDMLRSAEAHISLGLDVGQFDQEIAQDNAADYAHVLDMIVTTASGSDWETSLPIVHETVTSGQTQPNAQGSVKRVFVESHNFGLVKSPDIQTPVITVMLPLIFQLVED